MGKVWINVKHYHSVVHGDTYIDVIVGKEEITWMWPVVARGTSFLLFPQDG